MQFWKDLKVEHVTRVSRNFISSFYFPFQTTGKFANNGEISNVKNYSITAKSPLKFYHNRRRSLTGLNPGCSQRRRIGMASSTPSGLKNSIMGIFPKPISWLAQ